AAQVAAGRINNLKKAGSTQVANSGANSGANSRASKYRGTRLHAYVILRTASQLIVLRRPAKGYGRPPDNKKPHCSDHFHDCQRRLAMKDFQTKPDSSNRTISRRNMLLAGTTVAAASALASSAPVQLAQAQQRPATATGGKPNILVIMGDDVGW